MNLNTFHVDYLLAVARLPDRMYALVHGLTGRDELYKNPGTSLRSFIVGRHLKDEIVTLKEDMIQNVRECEEFSKSETIAEIVSRMSMRADKALSMLMSPDLAAINRPNRHVEIKELRDLLENLQTAYHNYFNANGTELKILAPVGTELKHSLFKLQDKLDQLNAPMPDFPTKTPGDPECA
jgi:hypothetical protein